MKMATWKTKTEETARQAQGMANSDPVIREGTQVSRRECHRREDENWNRKNRQNKLIYKTKIGKKAK